jgi:4-amino-4-deoxy-L-arabinose transferase-like glycosyltransferase
MEHVKRGRWKISAIGIAVAAIMLLRLLSLGAYPLFDNTESRYALVGQTMYLTGNWITPFYEPGVPFWAKPPLSFWLMGGSIALFGNNAFAARLPSFLVFAATAWLVYAAAERSKSVDLLAVLIFVSNALIFSLAGAAMTDPALMLGVTMTIVAFWKCLNSSALAWRCVFFGGLIVSILAKGPVGAVLSGLVIAAWVAWHGKWRQTWRSLPWITGMLFTAAAIVPWYALAEWRTPGFLRYFIIEEHIKRFLVKDWGGNLYGAPHTSITGTIWFYAFLAALPWSAIVIALVCKRRLRAEIFNSHLITDEWLRYALCWLVAPLLFYTFASAVVLPYVIVCMPAFALLAACVLHGFDSVTPRWIFATAGTVPVIALGLLLALQIDPASPLLVSQHNIVALYKQHAIAGEELVYFPQAPFSARFYLEGKVGVTSSVEELGRRLSSGNAMFAMRHKDYNNLPIELHSRFDKAADVNDTLLLRSRSVAPANDSVRHADVDPFRMHQ